MAGHIALTTILGVLGVVVDLFFVA